MGALLRPVFVIALIFVLALAAEEVGPLQQLTRYLEEHPDPSRGITLGLSAVGLVLLMGVLAFLFWARSRPMSEAEARRFLQTSAGRPPFFRRLHGRVTGREYRSAASFREIKDACRSGAWRHDPAWWPVFTGLLATLLLVYGVFGYIFVVGAPLIKLLFGAALIFATVRTAWSFWQA